MSNTRGQYRGQSAAESDTDAYSSSSSSSNSSGSSDEEEELQQQQQEVPLDLTPLRIQQPQQQRTPVVEGLTETEKVQLVTDIVEAGGIDNIGPDKYPLNRLLIEKADHYSLHESGKKRQIQNKVNDWKTRAKGRKEYNTYILSSAPTPSPNRRTPRTQRTASSSKTSSNRRRNNPGSSNRRQKNPQQSRQLIEELNDPPSIERTAYCDPNQEEPNQRARQPYTRPFNPIPSKLPMNDTQRNHLNGANLVNVDETRPEKNGTIMIYPFTNHQDSNHVLRNGYILEVQSIDRRWLELEMEAFEAWQVAPNEVLFKYPSTSYTFLHAVEEEEKGKTTAGFTETVVKQATNVPRNAIAADDARQFNYSRLVFPKDLDNNVYSPNAERGKIAPKVVPLVTTLNYKGPDVNGDEVEVSYESCVAVNIEFSIAVFEKDKRTMEQKGKKNALRDQMQSLSISPAIPAPPPIVSSASLVPYQPTNAGSAAMSISSVNPAPTSIGTAPDTIGSASSLQLALRQDSGAMDAETTRGDKAVVRKADEDARSNRKKKKKKTLKEQENATFEIEEDTSPQMQEGESDVVLQNDPSLWTYGKEDPDL